MNTLIAKAAFFEIENEETPENLSFKTNPVILYYVSARMFDRERSKT